MWQQRLDWWFLQLDHAGYVVLRQRDGDSEWTPAGQPQQYLDPWLGLQSPDLSGYL